MIVVSGKGGLAGALGEFALSRVYSLPTCVAVGLVWDDGKRRRGHTANEQQPFDRNYREVRCVRKNFGLSEKHFISDGKFFTRVNLVVRCL